MDKFKRYATNIIILAIVFVAGKYWPYYFPPADFGTCSFDNSYRFVVSQDETRLCRIVSVLDRDLHVVFHTSGYMEYGWHSGKYKTKVIWAKNTSDLFVQDGRGTLDVYLYKNNTWKGPYALRRIQNNGKGEYWLTSTAISWNPNEFSGIAEVIHSDPSNIQYDPENIPDEFLKSIYDEPL
ncbi:MAG: hypothetical protein RR296_11615 [Clostridia bacterium]